MNGFVIAIVIILVVITSLASQKQKRDRQKSVAKPETPVPSPVQAMPVRERTPLKPRVTQHVVAPSFESGHAHQETSLTGNIPCQVRTLSANPDETTCLRSGALLSCDDALRGVVYAEILGKPKALRKR